VRLGHVGCENGNGIVVGRAAAAKQVCRLIYSGNELCVGNFIGWPGQITSRLPRKRDALSVCFTGLANEFVGAGR